MTRWRPNNRRGAQQWPRRRQCTQSRAEKSPRLKLSSAAAAAANGKDATGSELLSKCQSVFSPPWTNLTKKKKDFYISYKKRLRLQAHVRPTVETFTVEKKETLLIEMVVFFPCIIQDFFGKNLSVVCSLTVNLLCHVNSHS